MAVIHAYHAPSIKEGRGLKKKRKPCAATEMVGTLRTEILQPRTLIQKRSHWTAMACQPGV